MLFRSAVDMVMVKTVPVDVQTGGELAEGLELESVTVNPQSVRVKGESENINELTSIMIPPTVIDLTTISGNFETSVDLTSYLPDGVSVTQNGAKWVVPKAGKVVYMKGTSEVDPAKALENPSALKLTYAAKKGTFKGSFKAYSLEEYGDNKKLKKYTVKVTGFVVDGQGAGRAESSRPAAGPFGVTIK